MTAAALRFWSFLKIPKLTEFFLEKKEDSENAFSDAKRLILLIKFEIYIKLRIIKEFKFILQNSMTSKKSRVIDLEHACGEYTRFPAPAKLRVSCPFNKLYPSLLIIHNMYLKIYLSVV